MGSLTNQNSALNFNFFLKTVFSSHYSKKYVLTNQEILGNNIKNKNYTTLNLTQKQNSPSLIDTIANHIITYPTPLNLNYAWGFGFLAGMCLSIQLLSGLFLTMHYTGEANLAFNSVEHIMRDANFGWIFRYTHANGASLFLGIIYLHISRGIFFKSYVYPRAKVWYSGMLLFALVMAAAFIGYVLPWGQMSFWGATVITNFVSAIPTYGIKIALWVWGGFGVDNATLVRFYALHFLLPFVIAALSLFHLIILHLEGSSNPLGLKHTDYATFYPYFFWKDVLGLVILLQILGVLVFFYPNLLGHSDNYIEANPLVTPAHIVPEWYFLPFYAILRCVPSKTGGVILLVAAIVVVFLIPILDYCVIIKNPIPIIYLTIFFFWVFSFYMLGELGAKPVEDPYIFNGRILTIFYFFYILFFISSLTFLLKNIKK